MEQLIIIGAGGFGREVLAWVRAGGHEYQVKGFLDDNPDLSFDRRLRAPLLCATRSYVPEAGDHFICAIGNPALRRSISERIMLRGGRFATVVHPSAIVAEGAKVNRGAIICPYALVSVDTQIGEGVVVYYHSSVDHDASIGSWTQISGHCDITAGAMLGSGVFVGSHATVLPKISVGDNAVIGAGAVVTRDVPAGSIVVGVPAKPHV